MTDLCAGCGGRHEFLWIVYWSDTVAHLCMRCCAVCEQLRLRPDSVHLHWEERR